MRPIIIQACLLEAGKILRITASGVGSFFGYERGKVLEIHVKQNLQAQPDFHFWTNLQKHEKILENLYQAH
jgi:hypothetical protein